MTTNHPLLMNFRIYGQNQIFTKKVNRIFLVEIPCRNFQQKKL